MVASCPGSEPSWLGSTEDASYDPGFFSLPWPSLKENLFLKDLVFAPDTAYAIQTWKLLMTPIVAVFCYRRLSLLSKSTKVTFYQEEKLRREAAS